MTTFIRSADDILSRTGEIDAASIASIMRAVRCRLEWKVGNWSAYSRLSWDKGFHKMM